MAKTPNGTVVGALAARSNFSHLLDRAARGEVLVITRHGTPVARLVRFEGVVDRADAQRAADELREHRRGAFLPKGLSVRDLIGEGRRC